MSNPILKTYELQLADKIVLAGDNEHGVSVVKQIANNEVTLFRPYPATADFSYTGGVICYVGIEEWKVPRDSQNLQWKLLSRTALK